MTSLYDLTPGTRVTVTGWPVMAGATGVVVEMAESLLNGHEVAVDMDPTDEQRCALQLCFMAHELTVTP